MFTYKCLSPVVVNFGPAHASFWWRVAKSSARMNKNLRKKGRWWSVHGKLGPPLYSSSSTIAIAWRFIPTRLSQLSFVLCMLLSLVGIAVPPIVWLHQKVKAYVVDLEPISDVTIQNTRWSRLMCELTLLASLSSKLLASVTLIALPSPTVGGLKWWHATRWTSAVI